MPNLGAIATLRTLQATVTQTARALGLHQIDSDANKKRRENKLVDWVELEVKRRLWWHVCSTDWCVTHCLLRYILWLTTVKDSVFHERLSMWNLFDLAQSDDG